MTSIPDADREAVARAIAVAQGLDPDENAPTWKFCGPNNEPLPWWQFFEEEADAAIAVLRERGWRPSGPLVRALRELTEAADSLAYEANRSSADEAIARAREILSAAPSPPGDKEKPD